jgi:hypothetical protein
MLRLLRDSTHAEGEKDDKNKKSLQHGGIVTGSQTRAATGRAFVSQRISRKGKLNGCFSFAAFKEFFNLNRLIFHT